MKLIKPSYSIIEQKPGLEGIYEAIETAGRTCYKSIRPEGKTAKDFVDKLIKNKHCYTGDSEVLTEDGWIKWKDYKGEKVATVNKNREFVGYETPTRIVSYKYSGNFYEYPELGIKVTDGHNMFGMFRDSKHNFYNENLYSLFSCKTPYKDNNGRSKTLGERTFKVPTNCRMPLITDPFYELVGFWLGDGCANEQTINKLIFHLKKERKIQYLQQLCSNLGYTFEIGKSNYYKVCSPNIGKIFNTKYYKGIKIINDSLNPIQIHSVIQGLINSDGSLGINTKTITFTNTSRSIIDWILKYASLAGYNVIDCGICHYTENHNACYKILFKTTQYIINNDSRKKNKKVIITNEESDVYCVTVSTGLILVRGTNGQTSICGNCAMLEHGTVYLIERYKDTPFNMDVRSKYDGNPHTKVHTIRFSNEIWKYITTNMRVIQENGWLSDLKYICEPTEYHNKRVMVHFTTSIGIGRELLRHRKFSFANESTRYCNYSKDKFDNEITFIIPSWSTNIVEGNYPSLLGHYIAKDMKEGFIRRISSEEELVSMNFNEIQLMSILSGSELYYLDMVNAGGATPQEAREVLPLATKSELIMTGFISDWRDLFNKRSSIAATGMPHPDMKALIDPLMQEFKERKYIDETV